MSGGMIRQQDHRACPNRPRTIAAGFVASKERMRGSSTGGQVVNDDAEETAALIAGATRLAVGAAVGARSAPVLRQFRRRPARRDQRRRQFIFLPLSP